MLLHMYKPILNRLFATKGYRLLTLGGNSYCCFSFVQLHLQSRNMASVIRHNFHAESELMLNKQINIELHASYVYQAMASHFDRDDVALPGFKKYFQEASNEEREHADKFMKYQNLRGGQIVLEDVKKPTEQKWSSGLEAMKSALSLEKTVYQNLLDIHKCGCENNDPHLTDWLEGEFLEEQVESIKNLSEHITNLTRVGPGLGEYMYDRETLSAMK